MFLSNALPINSIIPLVYSSNIKILSNWNHYSTTNKVGLTETDHQWYRRLLPMLHINWSNWTQETDGDTWRWSGKNLWYMKVSRSNITIRDNRWHLLNFSFLYFKTTLSWAPVSRGVENWNSQTGWEERQLNDMKHLSEDSGMLAYQNKHHYIFSESTALGGTC